MVGAPEAAPSPSFPQAALSPPSYDLHARQAAVVADLGVQALRRGALDDLFGRAVTTVAQTLGDEMCKVLELLPDHKALLLRSGVGWHEGLVGRGTVSAGTESQAGFTLLQGGPVVVRDLRAETRFDGPPLLHNHGVVSGMSTPIFTGCGVWGVLGVHSRRARTYDDQDVNFLVAVANILGAAVERRAHEDALRAANAHLEEADRVRTHFLQSISHELRTPLTPLLLQLEALPMALAGLDGAVPRPTLQRFEHGLVVARRSADRLAALVEDFADVSRLQVGRLAVERRPMDLAAVAREAAEAHRAYAVQRSVALEVHLPQVLPIVGDPQRLHQLLGNLLSNALKFTPAGGQVVVAARPDGDFAMLEVRDTGEGLSEDQQRRLFEPFVQVGPRVGREGGLGLGLYIARGIVEMHGGRIGVHSPGPGKGATFWFRIRLAEGHRLTERVGA
jgi:signal transduction histidine kinase